MLLLMCLLSATALSAETWFGGSGEQTLRYRYEHTGEDTTVGEKSDLYSSSLLNLQLSVYQEIWNLESNIRLGSEIDTESHQRPGTEISLDSLTFEAYLGDAATLTLGRYHEFTGACTLFQPLNFLHSQDIETLLAGNSSTQTTRELLKLSFYDEAVTASVVVAPFFVPEEPVSTDSRYFPNGLFPPYMSTPGRDYVITAIAYGELEQTENSFDDISVLFELAGTSAVLDWGVYGFYGKDSQVAYQAQVTQHAGTDTATITLQPVPGNLAGFGLSLATGFGSVSLYGDAALRLGDILGSQWIWKLNSVINLSLEQVMHDGLSLQYAAGATIDAAALQTFFLVEYTNFLPLFYDDEVKTPNYSHLGALISDTALFDDTFHIKLSTLYSFQDQSMLVYPILSWQPMQELALELGAPLFTGASDTELGTYSNANEAYVRITVLF